jgi:hypothetical protein
MLLCNFYPLQLTKNLQTEEKSEDADVKELEEEAQKKE